MKVKENSAGDLRFLMVTKSQILRQGEAVSP